MPAQYKSIIFLHVDCDESESADVLDIDTF
jgi:hypothetical protein